jgi:sterol desaturase/sphingolipid hydroxylase (fatty acid hydroxylase superfamily)
VLNTPAHHRVHHASNEACLDRNFGSVLIVFDRLFGTFAEAPEGETLEYGLKGRAPTNNPVRIALGEWGHLFRDVARARGLRQRLLVLLGPP